MSYDLNGNLATLADGSGTTTFSWNARDRLTELSGPGLSASFGYDGLGRRRTKTINGAQADFLYDGLNPVQEGVLPGTVGANVLTGLSIDEFLTRTDAAGARHFLPDALGSTLALTDATGAVGTEYTYEPFGASTAGGAASANPFQFTGRENDGTGLSYYRARYYHPGLGRFVSEDPIGFLGGDVNLYGYVRNSPVTLADPLGLRFMWGLGGTLGLVDINYNSGSPGEITVSVTTPQLGGGLNFCWDLPRKPPSKSQDPPPEEVVPTVSAGSRYLGVSFTPDLRNWCLNVGLAGGPLPVNVGVPLFSVRPGDYLPP